MQCLQYLGDDDGDDCDDCDDGDDCEDGDDGLELYPWSRSLLRWDRGVEVSTPSLCTAAAMGSGTAGGGDELKVLFEAS